MLDAVAILEEARPARNDNSPDLQLQVQAVADLLRDQWRPPDHGRPTSLLCLPARVLHLRGAAGSCRFGPLLKLDDVALGIAGVDEVRGSHAVDVDSGGRTLEGSALLEEDRERGREVIDPEA